MRVLLQTIISVEVADIDEVAEIVRKVDDVALLNLQSVLKRHRVTYAALADAGFVNYGTSALLPQEAWEDE